MNKKGYRLTELLPLALMLTVSIIAIAIGADVVENVQEGQVSGTAGCSAATNYTACSYAYNASEFGLEGVNELAGFMPTIGLVVAASIVIGILVYSFAFKND